jgi:hypothetical protein
MRRIGASSLVVVLLLGGCAGTPPPRTHDAPPLFRAATVSTPADPLWTHPRGPESAALPPPVPEPEPGPAPPRRARAGISVEVRFETGEGETVIAPRITAFDGRRASVSVLSRTAFVQDFEIERQEGAFVADPVVGLLHDGAVLEMTPRTAAGGRAVDLAYSLRTSRHRRPLDRETFTDLQGNRLTIQLPVCDRSEASGVRRLEAGVWGLLARLPDGEGRTIAVLARAEPVELEFDLADEQARDLALVDPAAPPGGPGREVAPDEDSLPARAARSPLPDRPAGRLDLRAVALPTDLPPGSVVEADAASDALSAGEPLEPGRLHLVTGLVPGARAACLLDEAFLKDFVVHPEGEPVADPVPATQVSGLAAEVGEDGALGLSWTTTPRWDRFSFSPTHDARHLSVERPWSETHRARVVPAHGARLVVLARLADPAVGSPARALGVLVRFVPE